MTRREVIDHLSFIGEVAAVFAIIMCLIGAGGLAVFALGLSLVLFVLVTVVL